MQNCRDSHRRSLDFTVRGEHLLDRAKGFAVKFASGLVGARCIGIDHAHKAHLAGEFELAINAGMVASEGADADNCDIDGWLAAQKIAPAGSGGMRYCRSSTRG